MTSLYTRLYGRPWGWHKSGTVGEGIDLIRLFDFFQLSEINIKKQNLTESVRFFSDCKVFLSGYFAALGRRCDQAFHVGNLSAAPKEGRLNVVCGEAERA